MLRTLLRVAAACALVGVACGTVETPAITRLGDGAPPDAGGCLEQTSGGPTSCKPDQQWNMYAVMDCSTRGLMLARRQFQEPCEGGYRSVTYACCPAPVDAAAADR